MLQLLEPGEPSEQTFPQSFPSAQRFRAADVRRARRASDTGIPADDGVSSQRRYDSCDCHRSLGQRWPLVHVEDICEAVILALEAPREAVHNEIFNVGDDATAFRRSSS
jgi:hypothetical protein